MQPVASRNPVDQSSFERRGLLPEESGNLWGHAENALEDFVLLLHVERGDHEPT